MSNILKQYSVTNENKEVRVINNNSSIKKLVFEAFNTVPKEEPSVETFEEFDEGIDADIISQIDVETEKEKMLLEAQHKAEEIIKDARVQADRLLDEAKQRAQILYADNKTKGYEDGLAQKEAEFKERRESLDNQYNKRKAALEKEYLEYTQALECDLIDAIILVFDKVFHIQFDEKKDILLHLVKNTISNIEVGRDFRIHVAHSNYKFMISHIDEIRERIGNDIDIEVVNDANLDSSGCQIETSFGVFDCGVDMELNNLVNDIKSLCS